MNWMINGREVSIRCILSLLNLFLPLTNMNSMELRVLSLPSVDYQRMIEMKLMRSMISSFQ